MTFQLVRATDTEIAIWQTEQGHIYVYAIAPGASGLERRTMRPAPDSTEPPEVFADEALRFATREAEVRQLIGTGTGPNRTNWRCSIRETEPGPNVGG